MQSHTIDAASLLAPPGTGELVIPYQGFARKPQACSILKVSPATLDRLVRAGKLPRYHIGDRISIYKIVHLLALVQPSHSGSNVPVAVAEGAP